MDEVMALLRKLGDRVPVIVVTHDSRVAPQCARPVLLQPLTTDMSAAMGPLPPRHWRSV
jgi:ABC-type lipoprotein export system ATPase subunit